MKNAASPRQMKAKALGAFACRTGRREYITVGSTAASQQVIDPFHDETFTVQHLITPQFES